MLDALAEFLGGKIAVALAGICLGLLAVAGLLLWLLLGQAEKTGAFEAANQQNTRALQAVTTAGQAADTAILSRKEKTHEISAEEENRTVEIKQGRRADIGAWHDAPLPDYVPRLFAPAGDANSGSHPGAARGAVVGNSGTALPGPD